MVGSVKSNSFVCIPSAGVREDDLIAWIQAAENLNRVDRAFAELHHGAHSFVAAEHEFEHANGIIFLTERRPADEDNVVEPLELDCSIDTQVWSRAFGQFFI